MPSPQQLFEEEQKRALARGDNLNQQSQDRLNAGINEGNQYGSYLNELYQPDAAGGGGYSSGEQQDIMGSEGLDALQMTPEEQAGAYLTGDEQSQIAGDPYGRMAYNRPDYLTSMQSGAEANQRAAYGQLGSNLNAAVDPSKLGLSQDYLPGVSDTLNQGDSAIQSGIEGTEGAVRGALDRSKLEQSQDAVGRIRMSDQERQDIITGAGISEGTGYRARADSLERSARAAGANPMGVAAYRARNEREMEGAAGDAMTQARIGASREAADRERGLESNRQSAEQYIAGQTAANEQALGGRRLDAQNTALNRRLGVGESAERMRMGGEQDISGRQMAAASEGGQAALGTERAIGQQQQQVGQFNTTTGMAGAAGAEQAAAERARLNAGNRQQTQQYISGQRYGRGMDANQATSQRATGVANTRLNQQNTARNYYGGRQQQSNQNVQNEANRQAGIYGTQGELSQGAARGTLQASAQPKWYEKAAGLGLQALGAFWDKGGVATKPTMGTVGESGPEWVGPVGGGEGSGQIVTEPTQAVLGSDGPEAVIPMNQSQDNLTRPSVAYGREVIRKPRLPQQRKPYGEMAYA